LNVFEIEEDLVLIVPNFLYITNREVRLKMPLDLMDSKGGCYLEASSIYVVPSLALVNTPL
jgi:hypothetical protein